MDSPCLILLCWIQQVYNLDHSEAPSVQNVFVGRNKIGLPYIFMGSNALSCQILAYQVLPLW